MASTAEGKMRIKLFGLSKEKTTAPHQQPAANIPCQACGLTGNHYTKDCPNPKLCSHCYLQGHEATACEPQCLACGGRGRIRIKAALNDHPEPTVRALDALMDGLRKATKQSQENLEARQTKLEALESLTDAQRAELAAIAEQRQNLAAEGELAIAHFAHLQSGIKAVIDRFGAVEQSLLSPDAPTE